MKIRASCDDGCSSDTRVAKLMKKYKVECVFYLPVEWHSLAYENGYEPLGLPEALGLAREHEVGSHTITHRHLTSLEPKVAHQEIFASKVLLSNMLDTVITKFCPPRGYTNKELTEYTLKYYQSQRLTKGPGLVHVHPNSGANGNIHWLEYAKNNPIAEIWMHSWELDRFNEWDNLERFLSENLHS